MPCTEPICHFWCFRLLCSCSRIASCLCTASDCSLAGATTTVCASHEMPGSTKPVTRCCPPRSSDGGKSAAVGAELVGPEAGDDDAEEAFGLGGAVGGGFAG